MSNNLKLDIKYVMVGIADSFKPMPCCLPRPQIRNRNTVACQYPNKEQTSSPC